MLVFRIAVRGSDSRKQGQKCIGRSGRKKAQKPEKKIIKVSRAEAQRARNKTLAEIKEELRIICGPPSTVLEKPDGRQRSPKAARVAPTLSKAEKSELVVKPKKRQRKTKTTGLVPPPLSTTESKSCRVPTGPQRKHVTTGKPVYNRNRKKNKDNGSPVK
ncbi:hypothetical protein AVEN_63137-1 [Araneus ventricosus]|uniref:Uncharacterized protein n=1 Tax=Araneus ventricosus TaxID=182803 RepID=A0A4Y2B3B1_ARAVE|nr:hypothetical protein AVEN_63137-1 [Araneus ventricosus]